MPSNNQYFPPSWGLLLFPSKHLSILVINIYSNINISMGANSQEEKNSATYKDVHNITFTLYNNSTTFWTMLKMTTVMGQMLDHPPATQNNMAECHTTL